VGVPLLRGGVPIGAITAFRTEVRPFSEAQVALLQTFADQAVIAIENVRLFTELQEKNQALTQAHAQVSEALEQQTATSEILRVISSSPTDVQPVFTAMAASAARLCEARDATILRVDGDVLRLVAHEGSIAPDAVLPLTEGTIGRRVIREQRAIHVADMQAAETHDYPISSEFARNRGFRTILSVPLLHGGQVIGLIAIRRAEVRPFTDRQVDLVRTFADQAVIAIENVRLFTELQQKNDALTQAHARVTESLEQQTATSEIQRVIASSPTDVQPVLEAVVQNASRLCGTSNVSLYRVEGSLMRKVAEHGLSLTSLSVGETRPIKRTTVSGRAILDGTTIHLPDHQSTDAAREYPDARRDTGIRTTIGAPLLREGVAIGVFTAYRTEPRPFTEREIALLQTFADQAAIAIENVRLFNELEARNLDLTEALDQQTATSEILRVISSSPTTIQAVFDTIANSAIRLFGACSAGVYQFDGELIDVVAMRGGSQDSAEYLRRRYPMRPTATTPSVAARAVFENAVQHVPDVDESDCQILAVGRARGYRAALAVPMLRNGESIGSIAVTRAEPGPYSGTEIDLLRTFADQHTAQRDHRISLRC
jgi:GAF domain-containing protein